jgi:hypothetical protein
MPQGRSCTAGASDACGAMATAALTQSAAHPGASIRPVEWFPVGIESQWNGTPVRRPHLLLCVVVALEPGIRGRGAAAAQLRQERHQPLLHLLPPRKKKRSTARQVSACGAYRWPRPLCCCAAARFRPRPGRRPLSAASVARDGRRAPLGGRHAWGSGQRALLAGKDLLQRLAAQSWCRLSYNYCCQGMVENLPARRSHPGGLRSCPSQNRPGTRHTPACSQVRDKNAAGGRLAELRIDFYMYQTSILWSIWTTQSCCLCLVGVSQHSRAHGHCHGCLSVGCLQGLSWRSQKPPLGALLRAPHRRLLAVN